MTQYRFRSFRLFSLSLLLMALLGIVGLASAQTILTVPHQMVRLQATVEATPIDPGEPLPLQAGKAATSPLDNDAIPYRTFSFSGKANQVVAVTVQRTAGNFGFQVHINSQSDVELAEANSTFAEAITFTIKLPQDGNYRIRVSSSDPGSGDFEAGTVSVTVGDAPKPATPAATTATAAR
ncbi:MAG: PPC domain-containing protein [Anaerolineae bacterium]|nr:PPC domain-containing protein [Anaerolineae bacterium]